MNITQMSFTLSIITCTFLGTLINTIAPRFTDAQLCCGRGFRIGNFGIDMFIHDSWGHWFGNLLGIIPCCMVIPKLCQETNVPFAIIIMMMFLNNFVADVICIIKNQTQCGFSGINYMFIEIILIWYSILLSWDKKFLSAICAICAVIDFLWTILHREERRNIGHLVGTLLGVTFGIALGLITKFGFNI